MSARIPVVLAGLLVLILAAGTPAPAAVGTTNHASCSFPVELTDATGTTVSIDAEPETVVVLQASAAQVMWDIGAREKVVGMPVAPYTAYLNGSANRTNVVNQDGTPNRERIVALDPDLVLAPNIIRNETVTQLRGDGLTVYKAGYGRSIADIYGKTDRFGRLVGRCTEAEATVDRMRSQVTQIERAVADEPRPRVLYTFYNFTVTEGTFIHEVIETAGGDNIAANVSSRGYPQLSDEVVVERDPEWVVVPEGAPLPSGEPYRNTTAYRHNQTLMVNENYVSQPGPRVVQPMARMAHAFHPDAFANVTATPSPSPSETHTTATDLPGFGAVTAVISVLALLATIIARRTGRF